MAFSRTLRLRQHERIAPEKRYEIDAVLEAHKAFIDAVEKLSPRSKTQRSRATTSTICCCAILAYDPFNYAVACKPCNTVLKANYFPIAGQRRRAARRPPSRDTERPFLIYPIGDLDDDPEDLIAWRGCHPLPANARGFDGLRAMVTIAIFKLDDPNERPMFYGGRRGHFPICSPICVRSSMIPTRSSGTQHRPM